MQHWFKKKQPPTLSPLEGYNAWAKTYFSESNPVKDHSNKWVEQLLPDLNSKTMLDAGCGAGYFCLYAEKQKAFKIVGVDFSSEMIAQAKKNCPSAEFHCTDLISFVYTHESFDIIICALVLGHIQSISPVLKNFAHLLKPGGELILTDFHPYQTQHHAKRTFVNPQTGNTLAIEHYLHSIDEIKNELIELRFVIQRAEEPLWNGVPVIYALKAEKKGS